MAALNVNKAGQGLYRAIPLYRGVVIFSAQIRQTRASVKQRLFDKVALGI